MVVLIRRDLVFDVWERRRIQKWSGIRSVIRSDCSHTSRRVHERLGVYERRSTRADVTAPPNLPTLAEIHSTRFDARHAAAFRDAFLSEWRAAVIK